MKKSVVLALAPLNDIHALSVKKAAKSINPNIEFILFDTEDFPRKASLSVTPNQWRLDLANGTTIVSENVRSIWWRRPSRHKIDSAINDPLARRFAENESNHAFDALVYWKGYKVVNPVDQEVVANRKAIQLRRALEVGLKVPKTLITNSVENFEDFRRGDQGSCIFKTLTPPLSTFGETRRLNDTHLPLLSNIKLAPVIFQEEVTKAYDLRVTVVGSFIFTTKIEIRNPAGTKYPDWRLDATAKAVQYELPSEVDSKIRELMNRLGLIYAAIDLIRACDGQYYFLEVNPTGQFLFNEVDTGQPISAAFANLLLTDN